MARNEQTPTRLFKMPPLRMPDLFAAPAAPEPMTPAAPPPGRRSYGDGPTNMAPFEMEARRRGPDIDMGVVRSVEDIPLQYDLRPAARAIVREREATLTGMPAQAAAKPKDEPPPGLPYLDLYGRRLETLTGVPADYMRAVVIQESSNNPHADNPTSTALGLGQNLVGNWLDPKSGVLAHVDVLGIDQNRLNMARTLDQMDRAQLDKLIAKLPPVSNTGDTFTSGVDTTRPEMQLAGMARALRDSMSMNDWLDGRKQNPKNEMFKREPTFEELFLLQLRTDPRWSIAVSMMQARDQHAVLSQPAVLGRDPEYWEMYAMHFAGNEAVPFLKAGDRTSINNVFSDDVLKRNGGKGSDRPGLFTGIKTVGQLKERLKSKFPQRWLTVEDIE